MVELPDEQPTSTSLRFEDEVVAAETDLLIEVIIAATLSAARLTQRRVDEVLLGKGVWR